MSEKAFAQAVVDAAALSGWRVYRTWRSDHSPSGFPDVVAVRGTRLICAELKSEGGLLRSEQHEWLEALGRAGAEVHVWRPSDWPELERVLAGRRAAA